MPSVSNLRIRAHRERPFRSEVNTNMIVLPHTQSFRHWRESIRHRGKSFGTAGVISALREILLALQGIVLSLRRIVSSVLNASFVAHTPLVPGAEPPCTPASRFLRRPGYFTAASDCFSRRYNGRTPLRGVFSVGCGSSTQRRTVSRGDQRSVAAAQAVDRPSTTLVHISGSAKRPF